MQLESAIYSRPLTKDSHVSCEKMRKNEKKWGQSFYTLGRIQVASAQSKSWPLILCKNACLFHTMKADLLHHQIFENEINTVAHIVQYIAFYNRERSHSGLGYQSPEIYEKLSP